MPPKRYSRPVPKRIRKYVQRQVKGNSETHTHTTEATGNTVDTTGYFLDLTQVAQGDADTERQGDELNPVSLKGTILLESKSTATAQNTLRVSIVKWKPDTADDPLDVLTDIYADTANSGNAFLSPFLTDNKKFTVLYDRPIVLSPWNSPASGTGTRLLNINLYGRKIPSKVYFEGEGTTGTNHIYLVIFGNLDTTAASWVYHQLRLNFKSP